MSIPEAIWAPVMSFHGDTVLDFSCQKQKGLLVEIFFVGHS